MMLSKVHKYLFVLNVILLTLNLFIVFKQYRLKGEIEVGVDAHSNNLELLLQTYRAESSMSAPKTTFKDVKVKKKTVFCSPKNIGIKLELNPKNKKAKYWPSFNTASADFLKYSYSIDNGFLVLHDAKRTDHKIFRVVYIYYENGDKIVYGLVNSHSLYPGRCGSWPQLKSTSP